MPKSTLILFITLATKVKCYPYFSLSIDQSYMNIYNKYVHEKLLELYPILKTDAKVVAEILKCFLGPGRLLNSVTKSLCSSSRRSQY